MSDPRYQDENRFLFRTLPKLLVISGVILFFLLRGRKDPEPEPVERSVPAEVASSAEPVSTPVPVVEATPEPTAQPTPPPPRELLAEGVAALRKGDKPAARKLLLEASVIDGQSAEAFNALATIDYADGQWESAVANFSAAIGANEKNPLYFLNRSESLRHLGRFEEALRDLRAARTLDPGNPLYPNKILLTRMQAGDQENVFKEVKATLNLGVDAYLADCLGPAAVIELTAGNTQHAVGYLRELRNRVPPVSFNLIVTDDCFGPFEKRPELSKLFPSP